MEFNYYLHRPENKYKMSKLIIDIGNTKTKVAVFKGEEIINKVVLEKLTLTSLNDILTNHSIQNIIYSSVVVLDKEIKDFLEQQQAIALSADLPLPFENQYSTPNTLGKDRIAAVAAAHYLFPKQNSLIIDVGTCITYDWLINGSQYIGGNIAPGLNMRMKAMHHFTNALPLLDANWGESKIGDSTKSAMQNGGMWGALMEMQGIIDWTRSEWREINVILTGGDTDFFANYLKKEIFAHPDLVLFGLNKILDYNVRLEE